MALQAGSTLSNGHYRIVRQIGRGGYGFVYLARDTLLGEQVAIKELIPALVGDEATLRRFLAEAKATMRLAHDHIVRTHNVFREAGNYYIVMEYMAGGSLEDRLRQQEPMPVDEALRIATEVCEGLSCAHRQGVVHCDLKPHNILFGLDSQTGRPGPAKVADFGIAHVSGEMLTRSWLTPDGFVAGTLPYMSPEQADGVRDDPRVDVYALGAVLYRMLTGRTYLDFDQRETPGAQADNVLRIRRQQSSPPSARNRRVPAWLDAVVLKALVKRPEDRFAGADALRAALLGRKVPRVPARPAARTGTAPPRSKPARRTALPGWFWLLAAVAVVLLIAIVVALVGLASGQDGEELVSLGDGPTVTWTTGAGTGLAGPAATSSPEPPPPNEPPVPSPESSTSTPEPLPPTATEPPTPEPPPPSPTPAPAARIAFVSREGGTDDIYLMDVDGSNVRRLTNTPAEEWHPAWSPDGTRLVFQCMSAESGSNVCLANADGSGYRQITSWSKTEAGAQRPVWSPDGTKIAVSRSPAGGGRNFVWIMDADGGHQVEIVEGRDPHWSPDGQQIAFIRYDGSGLQLWTTTPDGATVNKLTEGEADHMYPTWSPDGRQLAFEYDHNQVAVVPAGGSPMRTVVDRGSWNLSWAPDGLRLAIAPSLEGGIWLVNLDGTGLRQIREEGTQPAWQPVR